VNSKLFAVSSTSWVKMALHLLIDLAVGFEDQTHYLVSSNIGCLELSFSTTKS